MANLRILMLLAMLACLLASVFARADEASDDDFDNSATDGSADEEEPEDDYSAETKDENTATIDGRVLFRDYEVGNGLKIPAGEKVRTYVSFQNKVGGAPSELFIVAAHLNHVGNPDAFVQNFSAVRTVRTVNPGETATLQYDFRPDAMLEPMDYNLAIRVFFLNEDNATFVAVAFNSTITIVDPLGTDFKAITTWFILAALIGGAVYLFSGSSSSAVSDKKGGDKKKSASSASPAGRKSDADAIADDKSYNKDYVSAEHLKFREQLLKSQQRAAAAKSPSPKKK